MTKKISNAQVAAPVVGTPNNDQYNVITVIKGLVQMGRTYTQARDCAIAHVLATDIVGTGKDAKVKRGVAAKLATDTGVNKSDVSRIARIVVDNLKARRAALAIDVLHIDDDAASLAAAAEVGKLFVRKDKAASPKVATASTKGSTESETSVTKSTDETKSESVDVLALIDSWLRDASDAQFAARLVLLNNLLATIESDRAAAQAELDSAEVAA